MRGLTTSLAVDNGVSTSFIAASAGRYLRPGAGAGGGQRRAARLPSHFTDVERPATKKHIRASRRRMRAGRPTSRRRPGPIPHRPPAVRRRQDTTHRRPTLNSPAVPSRCLIGRPAALSTCASHNRRTSVVYTRCCFGNSGFTVETACLLAPIRICHCNCTIAVATKYGISGHLPYINSCFEINVRFGMHLEE